MHGSCASRYGQNLFYGIVNVMRVCSLRTLLKFESVSWSGASKQCTTWGSSQLQKDPNLACCQEARCACWAMHAHVARPAAADGADILRHICWTAIDRTTLLDHEDGLSHTMRSKLPAKAAWSNILASGSTARGSRIDRELVSRSWSCQCVCPVPRRSGYGRCNPFQNCALVIINNVRQCDLYSGVWTLQLLLNLHGMLHRVIPCLTSKLYRVMQ